MKITVCIGSSCHLKGSRQIVELLQGMIADHHLQDQIKMSGAFCMGSCMKGVCVRVEEELISLQPEDVRSFFDHRIVNRLSQKP